MNTFTNNWMKDEIDELTRLFLNIFKKSEIKENEVLNYTSLILYVDGEPKYVLGKNMKECLESLNIIKNSIRVEKIKTILNGKKN